MQDSLNFGAVESLEREIAYRELLLEEVIHRTKNQLQATILAIDDEAVAASSSETAALLRRIKGQLIDLAQSHRQTFGTPEADMPLADRLMRLCASVQDSYGARARHIRILFAMGDISLPRHQEIALSLVLRELVANACKHAFPGIGRGTVIVNLGLDGGGSCRLRVYDDGIGYEKGMVRTTGLRLVAAFARGLRGRFDLRCESGTVAELCFPLGS